jgi:hypothetical protein
MELILNTILFLRDFFENTLHSVYSELDYSKNRLTANGILRTDCYFIAISDTFTVDSWFF